jgi:hypothetical protein
MDLSMAGNVFGLDEAQRLPWRTCGPGSTIRRFATVCEIAVDG